MLYQRSMPYGILSLVVIRRPRMSRRHDVCGPPRRRPVIRSIHGSPISGSIRTNEPRRDAGSPSSVTYGDQVHLVGMHARREVADGEARPGAAVGAHHPGWDVSAYLRQISLPPVEGSGGGGRTAATEARFGSLVDSGSSLGQ